jgi:hypothetical protein
MGQIANQMLMEAISKLKEKLKDKKAEKTKKSKSNVTK